MHVLRKLASCLSSTTCDNDESLKQEENRSSTTNTLSRLSPIEDITIKTAILNKDNSTPELRDNNQTIIMSER
jgi:hypothetical protein